MKLAVSHDWQVSPAQAADIQRELSRKVICKDRLTAVSLVAGVDVGFEDKGNITRAAIAVLSFPELKLVETSIARRATSFPYIPGFLSFRELPAVLSALENLEHEPDIFLCDGQGYAHPRRFGIACHLGVLINKPAVGVGKTRLIGKFQPVDNSRGAWQPLIDKGETVGAVLRTREGVKPIYVSSGHYISLASAIEYVMACTTKYKLPQTTRMAHRLASNL